MAYLPLRTLLINTSGYYNPDGPPLAHPVAQRFIFYLIDEWSEPLATKYCEELGLTQDEYRTYCQLHIFSHISAPRHVWRKLEDIRPHEDNGLDHNGESVSDVYFFRSRCAGIANGTLGTPVYGKAFFVVMGASKADVRRRMADAQTPASKYELLRVECLPE